MLTFIIRHLQETTIAALILTAAAAILTGSTWAAVIGGALTLGFTPGWAADTLSECPENRDRRLTPEPCRVTL